MKLYLRHTVLSIALLSLIGALGACKAADKSAADNASGKPGATPAADANAIAGLATDRDRVSYMVGMQLAKGLQPIKDEIDVNTVAKAISTSLAGGKLLMSDAQAAAAQQALMLKMQAKQIADQQVSGAKNQQEGDAFMAVNGKKPGVKTTASGLQYQVIVEGAGAKPKAEDGVKVNYTGSTLDGKKFDSSQDHGGPVGLKVNGVIPGWTEALQLMGVGSKYVLWVPGKLAYGEQGTPGGPIGPNATLKFEVELVSIDGK